ncbi:MAG: hypothetical protein M1549_00800 [Candidatus Dependentiae bacterium]|nr:hypothetical protein [Candidatus Dependentiae bacterium]
MDKSFFPEASQLAVSIEVLQFFAWLVEHEPSMIRKLIHQAVKSGFGRGSSEEQAGDHDDLEKQLDLHLSMAEFFGIIEAELSRHAYESRELALSQSPISPVLSQIDRQSCDAQTMAVSAHRATAALEKGLDKDAKEVLCLELLKHWRPRTPTH